MTEMRRKVSYNAIFSLANVDLFSGTERDPMVIAQIDAEDFVAIDNIGNRLPYHIELSIFGIEINRDEMFIEDLDRTLLRHDQRICVSIVVFETEEEKAKYLENIL